MRQVKPLSPLVYVEIEVSYRWRGSAPACCYVTAIEQRGGLHRRIVATQHITAAPEVLVDQVNALVREWTLEHVLSHVEPF